MTDRLDAQARLQERARLLARPLVGDERDGEEHLMVAVGAVRLAVPVTALRHTAVPGPVTALPGLPPELRGVRPLRGEVVCLADAGAVIGTPAVGEPASQPVVVLEDPSPLGLLVDEVLGVVTLDPSDLLPPPARDARLAGVLAGLTAEGTLVLDAAALLTDPRLHLSASADDEGRP